MNIYSEMTFASLGASPQRLSEQSQSSACVPHSHQPQVVSLRAQPFATPMKNIPATA
jgi:hypothetical protein